MTAHPRLRSAHAPRGNTFPCSKESGKDHKSEADGAEREADHAAAARALWSIQVVEDVHDCGTHQNCQCGEGPTALRLVHSHFAEPWPSMVAKNVSGSTRCAASCGQAETQLGSFKFMHRSQEVTFCLMAAFLRPVRSGSS